MLRRILMLACAATVATACSSATSGSANTSATTTSHNVLSAEEMAPLASSSLYETVQRLRPNFLRSRTTVGCHEMSGDGTCANSQGTAVDVYINGQRTEGVDALRQITTSTVLEVRFFEPQEANVRFGTGHGGGVISVTLKS